ncbi:speckle-type POZ [Fusarium heterosporum]|uniref:Speckle-type POZ n=1 Tax=Fusarium heterosporum TaxID=42747 RepID=A0A8H5WQC2_FUSHE|nr:speckle-type POZ [Fusarium heterosporum]
MPALSNPSLADLIKDGDIYDFTLTCDGEVFKLHQAIVCPKSFVIQAILEERSEELQNIYVEGFDSDTVRKMIDFIYLGRYKLDSIRYQNEAPVDQAVGSLDELQDEVTVQVLLSHLRTYYIANRFEVEGLWEYSSSQIKRVFASAPTRLVPRLLQEMTSSTVQRRLPWMVASDIAFNIAGRIEDVVAAPGFHRLDVDSALFLEVIEACGQRVRYLQQELEFSRRIQDAAMWMANTSIEEADDGALEVTSQCHHCQNVTSRLV